MECKISTHTVSVFIVFDDRQYYNVSKYSSDEQTKHELQRAEKHFLHFGYTLYTQNKEKNHFMSQFANLNFNHLISFKVLRAQPKADGDVAVMF